MNLATMISVPDQKQSKERVTVILSMSERNRICSLETHKQTRKKNKAIRVKNILPKFLLNTFEY